MTATIHLLQHANAKGAVCGLWAPAERLSTDEYATTCRRCIRWMNR